MTPQEKAEELVRKFNPFTYTAVHAHNTSYEYTDAKKCALIAVDEILNHDPTLPIEGELDNYADDIKLSAIYWQQVKTEIEKL
jgi:hypothetical protein